MSDWLSGCSVESCSCRNLGAIECSAGRASLTCCARNRLELGQTNKTTAAASRAFKRRRIPVTCLLLVEQNLEGFGTLPTPPCQLAAAPVAPCGRPAAYGVSVRKLLSHGATCVSRKTSRTRLLIQARWAELVAQVTLKGNAWSALLLQDGAIGFMTRASAGVAWRKSGRTAEGFAWWPPPTSLHHKVLSSRR